MDRLTSTSANVGAVVPEMLHVDATDYDGIHNSLHWDFDEDARDVD